MDAESSSKIKLYITSIFVLMIIVCFILIIAFSGEEHRTYFTADYEDMYANNTNSNILFETNEYMVIRKIKINKKSYTQGLFMDTDNTLIESGGLYGESHIQKYNIDTPDNRIFRHDIDRKYFAEGACLVNNSIYQLTWMERTM